MSNHDDELRALLALDALEPGEQADAELRAGTFADGYRDVARALAEPTASVPPPALRAQVLSAATGRRAPGRPTAGAAACTPGEAYRRTADDLAELLGTLTPAEWSAPAHTDHGTVRDLMAHLVGVEQLSRRWLDEHDDVPIELDHVASTRDAVAALSGVGGPEVARRWHAATAAVSAAAATGNPDRVITFHDLRAPVGGFLVIRSFELWAHTMDIAVATGRTIPALDPERMALLSSRLMDALPVALSYRGRTVRGRSIRFVLTGPAGGTYTVPLYPGEEVVAPAATVVADTVELCRVAARRLAAEELPVSVDGDRELAALVLSGLDGFARD